MYTLAIPDRQKKRLGYLKQNWIEFEDNPSMEGFFDIGFPGMDEYAFRNIVMKLKQQGVTTIGADEVLTEKKIMKLTDLISEEFSKNLDEQGAGGMINALKNILHTWQTKQYADDKSRWEEYYMDIEELVMDFEDDENEAKYTSNLKEQKIRKVIKKMLRQ